MPAALDDRIDWPEVYGEWIKAKLAGESMTSFAERIGRDRTYLSTKFKAIQMQLIRDQMADIVEKGVDVVAKSLKDKDVTPEFALKATTSMADRIGMAPSATVIENNVTNNIGIALFPPQDEANLKTMLGVDEDVQSNRQPGREARPNSDLASDQ